MGGHNVATVWEQQLSGTTHEALLQICASEDRVLVTLDLDFANPITYPPNETSGVIALRGRNQLFTTMVVLTHTLVEALRNESAEERLWIIEPGRLRIHGEG